MYLLSHFPSSRGASLRSTNKIFVTVYVVICETYALIKFDWELASFSLVIPLADPVNWAQGGEGLEKDLAWLELLALHVDTLVVVNVVLGTVLRLVGEGKSWVKLRSVKFEVF